MEPLLLEDTDHRQARLQREFLEMIRQNGNVLLVVDVESSVDAAVASLQRLTGFGPGEMVVIPPRRGRGALVGVGMGLSTSHLHSALLASVMGNGLAHACIPPHNPAKTPEDMLKELQEGFKNETFAFPDFGEMVREIKRITPEANEYEEYIPPVERCSCGNEVHKRGQICRKCQRVRERSHSFRR